MLSPRHTIADRSFNKPPLCCVILSTPPQVIDDVRNFLFGMPGQGGLDLISLNIQRGRDHGLGSFGTVRAALGLPPLPPGLAGFQQLTDDAALATALHGLYGSMANVDLWVGLLSEAPAFGSGSLGGATLRAALLHQFRALREGDRFFYLGDEALPGILADVGLSEQGWQGYRLKHIIEANTGLKGLQENVFFVKGCGGGKKGKEPKQC